MKGKVFWIGGVVVLLMAVGVTIALAEVAEADYYACVNNASGTIHMITIEELDAGETCNNNEEMYSWNQDGPQGEPGLQGEVGPAGATGATGPVGPAGDVTIEQYCDLELRIKDALPSFPLTPVCEPPPARLAIETLVVSIPQELMMNITGTGEPYTTIELYIDASCLADLSGTIAIATDWEVEIVDEYFVPSNGIIDWSVDLVTEDVAYTAYTYFYTWTIGEIDTLEGACSAPYYR